MVASSVILAVPMERRCCCSQTSSGVWQWEGGGKPCCKEERRWQRVWGRMGCRQWGKGSPGWEGESWQFPGKPWPRGSHQPCALHCSLQLPLATVWQSLCSPWFAHQHQKTVVAPMVPAERGLLTIPRQPAQPQSLQLGAGAASPHLPLLPALVLASGFVAPGPMPVPFLGLSAVPHARVGDWQAPRFHRGAPRCHAHLLCLLRPMLLVLCPPSSGPCPVPHHQPARLSPDPSHLPPDPEGPCPALCPLLSPPWLVAQCRVP